MDLAFELACKYRNHALILSDGLIGQMMEKVELPPQKQRVTEFDQSWVITGKKGRERNIITSLNLVITSYSIHYTKLYD